MSFNYEPAQINDGGLNQMRFELGDCLASDYYLSDEEIKASISGSGTFKRAELRLIKSLLFRFSYEVDTKIHEAEFKLADRVSAWRKLKAELEEELAESPEEITPSFGFKGKSGRRAAFGIGMHDVY